MSNNLYKGIFIAVVMLLGASAEELLPKFLGVGFPVLMTAALCLVPNRPQFISVALLALSAGAVEDAVAALPMMTSASFFLLAAIVIRYFGYPLLVSALAYPLYQVWLAVWSVVVGGMVFWRILLAVPFGWLTAVLVSLAVGWLERRAAVNDQV